MIPNAARHALLALALSGACAALYGSALDAPFTFDDIRNIVENPNVRLERLAPAALWEAATGNPTRRPVAYLSFALDHLRGGFDPRRFRITNLAVHAACGVLVSLLALALYRREEELGASPRTPGVRTGMALLAGLIFVAHPVQTQAVTYVVQRMSGLAALFYLLAWWLFLRGRRAAGRGRRIALFTGCGLAWLLALGSKETAATLPLLLLLHELYFERDLRLGRLRRFVGPALALLAVLALPPLLLLPGNPSFHAYESFDFTPAERLLTETRVVVFYLSLVAFPHPARLNLIHDFEISRSLLEPTTTLAATLLLVALLGIAAAGARRQRLLSFAILWWFLQLALESSLLPLDLAFEHRLYLPLFGPALLAPLVLERALAARPALAVAVAAAGLVALGGATRARNEVWRDELALWSDAVAKSPGSARAHHNLAVILARRGRSDDALRHHRLAVERDPDEAVWRADLGLLLAERGALDEAATQLRIAVELEPRLPRAQEALGVVYLRRGWLREAALHASRAAALRPESPSAHYNLGLILARLGRRPAAARHFARALELRPGYPEARDALAALGDAAPP